MENTLIRFVMNIVLDLLSMIVLAQNVSKVLVCSGEA